MDELPKGLIEFISSIPLKRKPAGNWVEFTAGQIRTLFKKAGWKSPEETAQAIDAANAVGFRDGVLKARDPEVTEAYKAGMKKVIEWQLFLKERGL